jgi:hypothetical protein
MEIARPGAAASLTCLDRILDTDPTSAEELRKRREHPQDRLRIAS